MKAVCAVSPYDSRTENIRNKIIGNRMVHVPNKYYKSAEGNFWYYINIKSYLHCIKPYKIKVNGEFSHYEIKDFLLNKDNTVKEVNCYGRFETVEEIDDYIKENLADGQ